jgi:ParB family transcriptional regulator, chromosome partitioning protein
MSEVISSTDSLSGVIDDIDISKIRHPKNQLRSRNYYITELAASIRRSGLLQPIIVRMMTDKHYEIVAGNRRYEACKSLGWRKITCHIEELDDRAAFEVSLVENIQRRTLSPLEEAEAFRRYVTDFGWGGVSNLANKIGKSVSFVTKRIALLRLPPEILESIKEYTLSTSAAEELCFVKNINKQSELAKIVAQRHLTLRKMRQMVETIRNQDSEDSLIIESNNNIQKDLCHQMQRSLDKSIIVLKIALNKLDAIINDTRDDIWLTQEILLQHRRMLHNEIDILLREKRKTEHRLVKLLK